MLSVKMLSVVIHSIIMMSVANKYIILIVIKLNAIAPSKPLKLYNKNYHIICVVTLSVSIKPIMLNVIMLIVIMLST
jgi:hypothetical protein